MMAALVCLGLAAVSAGTTYGPGAAVFDDAATVRSDVYHASRAKDRQQSTMEADAKAAAAAAGATIAKDAEAAKKEAEEAAQAAAKAAEAKKNAEAAAAAKAAEAKKTTEPTPVAGLGQWQMNNAQVIVETGKAMGLPPRAYVLAVACAMQESNLFNLASGVYPESFQYSNQGSGSDHDSIGLFQQRPSSGWGTVQQIMNPTYASTAFYNALMRVGNWQGMALTYAVQAVQVSAFPEAYAKHEANAQAVVNALT